MNSGRTKSWLRLSPGVLVGLAVLLGLGFLAVVLVPGFELASEVADSTRALKFVGQQQRHPTVIRASLDTMHDRLGAHGYIQEAQEQLRDADGKLSLGIAQLTAPRDPGWFAFLGTAGAQAEPMAGKHALLLRDIWTKEHQVLAPVLAFSGVPYQDSETSGTVLNEGGRGLERDISTAIRQSKRAMSQLDGELSAVILQLQASNEGSAAELKLVMLVGVAIGLALIVIVTVLAVARQRQTATLRAARQQTADILRTVKDGLFLLDSELVIGGSYSSAMEALFQRNDFAGLKFGELLKGIVTEKTLTTALKFVGVLWSERTKENLVKSINPLGEVEVSFEDGKGKTSKRYLQFEFHRVRLDGIITHVLVSVSDVTARVDLARELQASQSQAQAQVDTLLGILHVDPNQLASFLNDSNAAMKMINAVLREPAREESAFRKKLDTLFRQVHSVKGEAAALGLSSIEERAHSFEDHLKTLRDKDGLSGNDFLPLVIKLDDLLTHLQTVGELVSRLSRLHIAADAAHTSTDVIKQGSIDLGQPKPPSDGGVSDMLQQLLARVAAENKKDAILECVGFDIIPEEYRRVIKDISVQAVRNSVVHGIEPAEQRVAAGKNGHGTLKLIFQDAGTSGFRLTVEDDGRGLSTERIRETAVTKGFLTAEKAQAMEARQLFALLFQAGFSTVENATKDAGRGVGMNVMAGLMQQVGGKVSVATQPGKFTRLTMSLPQSKQSTVAA